MTPYYSEDGITIYHGDCREVLPALAPVGLVVTSPPYNQGDMSGGYANLTGGYASYDDQMDSAAYVAWQQETLRYLWDLLDVSGAIFYNHKPLIDHGRVALPMRLLPPEVILRQVIIWNRKSGMNWAPGHFVPVCEWILLLAKPAFRLINKTASVPSDVWTISPEMSERFDHPAPFPKELPARAIAATSAEVILDPFMGSGTTLRAAKDLGRNAIGIEIEERYCEIAAKRLAQGVLDFNGAPTTRPVTDAPASLLQGGSMGQSLGGRTGDGESSA